MAKNRGAVALAKMRWAGKTQEEKSSHGAMMAEAAKKSMTAAERSERARNAAHAKHRKYLEKQALKKI